LQIVDFRFWIASGLATLVFVTSSENGSSIQQGCVGWYLGLRNCFSVRAI